MSTREGAAGLGGNDVRIGWFFGRKSNPEGSVLDSVPGSGVEGEDAMEESEDTDEDKEGHENTKVGAEAVSAPYPSGF